MALLHFGTGRLVARSGILRLIPASSRQRRTSCLDETVIKFGSLELRKRTKGPDVWLFPLLGPKQSIGNTTLDNSGNRRGLSDGERCQASSQGAPTRNQQWLAVPRSDYFSGLDRSLCARRDREGRSCTYHQGTGPQSNKQAHLSEVGFVPTGRGQTLSRPRVAQEVARGPENKRPRSQPHVPLIREGHAVGIDSAGSQSDQRGRTQRSQQTPAAASYPDGEGVWDSSQSTCSSVSLHGAARWLHRTSYQRNHGPTVERNQLRKPGVGNQRRICPQPGHEVENRIFPRPIASGSGGRDYSSRVEAALPSYRRGLGVSQPANRNALRFWFTSEAALRAEISGQIGWHTFRHSYRAWLDETNAPLGVQQKLMRHANISTTMNVYGGAFMEAKRKANTSVVQRVFPQKQVQ